MQNVTPTLSNQTHFNYELTWLSIHLFIIHFQPNIKYLYLNIYEAHFDLYNRITTISAYCEVSFERRGKWDVGQKHHTLMKLHKHVLTFMLFHNVLC